jgi:hypothetical protein
MKFLFLPLFLFSLSFPQGGCDVAAALGCPLQCGSLVSVSDYCMAYCLSSSCPDGGLPPDAVEAQCSLYLQACRDLQYSHVDCDVNYASCVGFYDDVVALSSDIGDASSRMMEVLSYTLMGSMLLFSFLVGFGAGNR